MQVINSSIHKLLHAHIYAFGVFVALSTFVFFAGGLVVANGQSVGPSDSHVVNLNVDGSQQIVPTRANNVEELLQKAGVTLNQDDLVEPALSAEITDDNFNVHVYRAKPVTIIDGLTSTRVMTPYTSPRLIAEKAGIKAYPEDDLAFSASDNFVNEKIIGQKLTIDRATQISFKVYGEQVAMRTQSTTVKELLAEKSIVLGVDDRVSLPLETVITEGLSVEVWREGKQTISVDVAIPKPVRQIQDTTKPVGFKEVQKQGTDGKRLVAYEIEIRNGVEFSRKEITSVITIQPQEEVVVVGTKNNYSGTLNEWLTALRQCEAGGVYARNTNNGFYGGYQFMLTTWNRIAGKIGRADLVGVRPDLASPADQDAMIIANTKLSSGGLASQNPGCYKKLGLSQFPPQ